jgi:hypothetical protein
VIQSQSPDSVWPGVNESALSVVNTTYVNAGARMIVAAKTPSLRSTSTPEPYERRRCRVVLRRS